MVWAEPHHERYRVRYRHSGRLMTDGTYDTAEAAQARVQRLDHLSRAVKLRIGALPPTLTEWTATWLPTHLAGAATLARRAQPRQRPPRPGLDPRRRRHRRPCTRSAATAGSVRPRPRPQSATSGYLRSWSTASTGCCTPTRTRPCSARMPAGGCGAPPSSNAPGGPPATAMPLTAGHRFSPASGSTICDTPTAPGWTRTASPSRLRASGSVTNCPVSAASTPTSPSRCTHRCWPPCRIAGSAAAATGNGPQLASLITGGAELLPRQTKSINHEDP
jgi:hypothetical protein